MCEKFKNLKVDTEKVRILDSHKRVLSEDIISQINVPEFNRSTVDGYAIKSNDSHGCSDCMPSFLEVDMEEAVDIDIKNGQCVYVPTGAMMPQSSNSVTIIEHVEKLDDTTIAIHKPMSVSENIVYKGDDIKQMGNSTRKR